MSSTNPRHKHIVMNNSENIKTSSYKSYLHPNNMTQNIIIEKNDIRPDDSRYSNINNEFISENHSHHPSQKVKLFVNRCSL
jgi:hypothetical protein